MAPVELARRAADHLSHRPRPGARAPEGGVRTGTCKPLYNVIARITGIDLSGRMGHPRQPSRRVGERRGRSRSAAWSPSSKRRARSASSLKQGWRPEAHASSTPRGTARSRGCSARPNGSRSTTRNCEKAVVYINTRRQRPRLPQRRRLAHARALRQRRGEGHQGSGDGHQRLEAAAGASRSPTGAAERAPRRARGPISASARSDRVPTTRRSSSTPASPSLNLSFGGRGRRRHLPLDLRRLLSLHEVHRHRLRLRPRAGADDGHRGDPAGGRRPAAVRVHEPRRHGADVREGARSAAQDSSRTRSRERNRQIEDGVFAAIDDPRVPLPAPKMERSPPAINFAPLENAAEALTQAAERYNARCGGGAAALALNAGAARGAERPLRCRPSGSRPTTRVCRGGLVSAPAVCAGLLHRLRREDDARGAGERSSRSATPKWTARSCAYRGDDRLIALVDGVRRSGKAPA